MSSAPWDAALLARIAHLHLRARNVVDGWRQGEHRSRRTTSAIEFVDHQEYAPGDPIKYVDWKVAARTDRLVIRRHSAETEVPVTLLLDVSGDLGTEGHGDADESKLGTALIIAATLAVFLQRHGDPVGLELIGGEDVTHRSIPVGGRTLPAIMRSLAEVSAGGQANLAEAFDRLGERLPRRSVLILISDLMEEPLEWGPKVAALVRRGIDLRVLHLHDPDEWTLQLQDPSRLYSPEGGDAVPIDPVAAREAMETVVASYLAEVRGYLGRQRGQHHLVAYNESLDGVIRTVLRGRS